MIYYEGYVSTKSEYKLEMNHFEAKQLKFWNYYFNPNQPELIRFGSGLHRYLSHEQAAQILRDVMNAKMGTKDELLANRFFEHFCKTNGIDSTSLQEFNGALRRSVSRGPSP